MVVEVRVAVTTVDVEVGGVRPSATAPVTGIHVVCVLGGRC